MKVTKNDIEHMKEGDVKTFTLTPAEMISARSYIYQRSMVLGRTYRTKYNRNTCKLTITRTL